MSEQSTTEDNSSQKMEALAQALKTELTQQQDFVYAIVGGLSAALLSAVIWAVITVSTGYQIGYMAIGVGLLVGFSVRLFGAGIDISFGAVGAFFALLGCALGNLLSQVGFIAASENIGYFETITLLNSDVIVEIYKQSFSPMDIVFYAVAAYEGYKFAFRNLTQELAMALEAGKVLPPLFARWRLPIVVTLFIGLSLLAFVVSRGSDEIRTFSYESGGKRAEGALAGGRENGPWQTWWENGNLQSQGLYVDGQPDSLWTYYDEEGQLSRQLTYSMGIQHGPSIDYYPGGTVATKGQYKNGRQDSLWVAYHESGGIAAKGYYFLDQMDGDWEFYYDNGQLMSKGQYDQGIQTGPWNRWTEEGKKTVEQEFDEEGIMRIINMWNEKGKQVITDGNGDYKSYYYVDGPLMEGGAIRNGYRVGKWERFDMSGKLLVQGEYKDNVFVFINAWDSTGNQIVKSGEGNYVGYVPDSPLIERGAFKAGLKTGTWELLSVEDLVLSESTFVEGKQEGIQRTFHQNGQVQAEGNSAKDKRVGQWNWYNSDGGIESTASFVDGKKEGEQQFFDESGDITRVEVYRGGELVESRIGS